MCSPWACDASSVWDWSKSYCFSAGGSRFAIEFLRINERILGRCRWHIPPRCLQCSSASPLSAELLRPSSHTVAPAERHLRGDRSTCFWQLCENYLRSGSILPTNTGVYDATSMSSLRRKSLNRMRNQVSRSVPVVEIAFSACSLSHSDRTRPGEDLFGAQGVAHRRLGHFCRP
jgi:hypothetical protein